MREDFVSIERVTVTIPAFNAARTLPAQLDALANQTYGHGFEVIVVDNNSSDGTGDVARRYSDSSPYAIRVINEGRQGINWARNAGIEAAPDGAILLCDADDEVDEGWLAAMVSALEPGSWVAGRQDYAKLNTEQTREIWDTGTQSTFAETDPYVDKTYGCNCGFHRSMWETVGRFDPRLNGTGGDENEFFMRAYAAGFRPRHVPQALVGYRLRPGVWRMVRQRYRQGKNQVAMRQLPGGQLLSQQFTATSEVGLLLKTLVALPLYLATRRRRCLWLASVSRRTGRLVGLGTKHHRRGSEFTTPENHPDGSAR